MTNYASTGATAHHTLTANTADVVTLSGQFGVVNVLNRDPAADLWFTIDTGPTGNRTITTPTIAGDGCYWLPAGSQTDTALTTYADGGQTHRPGDLQQRGRLLSHRPPLMTSGHP